jgi:serine protease
VQEDEEEKIGNLRLIGEKQPMPKVAATICTAVIVVMLTSIAAARVIVIPGDCASIGEGIAEASAGDTVLVSPGVYHERITLRSGIALLAARADSTIIDGSCEGDIIVGADSSIISGFTIRNSGLEGGAVRCQGTSPLIRGNYIVDNASGIICLEGARPVIEFNIITGCDDGSDFGTVALHCKNSSPIIRNNTISDNAARYAILCESSSAAIKNNIISGNWGGIGCYDATPSLSHNNVWNNNTYGDYSGCESGEGSISVDPLFMNPPQGDYRLRPESPCIAAGDPSDRSSSRPRVDIGALEYIESE